VLSLLVATLTAFLSALWRDSFLTPEQVERELGMPVLAAIPERVA
jgi:capsular polysaccharide biosynthesis protein